MAKLDAKRDPDNPNTVILSRWPTKKEKKQFSKEVRKIRSGSPEPARE
jgi:hypothetical protein